LPTNGTLQPAPIQVAPKPVTRQWKKARNVFYDNHNFPDESDAYNHLLHNIDGGVVLRKRHIEAPALDEDDPVLITNSQRLTMVTGSGMNLTCLTSCPRTAQSSLLSSSNIGVYLTIEVYSFQSVTTNAITVCRYVVKMGDYIQ
jgi:hypothetical protein